MWFLLNFNFLFFSFYSRLPLASPKALKAKLQPHLFFFSRWEIKTCVLLDAPINEIHFLYSKYRHKVIGKITEIARLVNEIFCAALSTDLPRRSSHDAVCLRFARKFLHNWLQFPSFRSFLFTKRLGTSTSCTRSREIAGSLLNWHLLISFVHFLWLERLEGFNSTMRRVTRIMDARMFSLDGKRVFWIFGILEPLGCISLNIIHRHTTNLNCPVITLSSSTFPSSLPCVFFSLSRSKVYLRTQWRTCKK